MILNFPLECPGQFTLSHSHTSGSEKLLINLSWKIKSFFLFLILASTTLAVWMLPAAGSGTMELPAPQMCTPRGGQGASSELLMGASQRLWRNSTPGQKTNPELVTKPRHILPTKRLINKLIPSTAQALIPTTNLHWPSPTHTPSLNIFQVFLPSSEPPLVLIRSYILLPETSKK